MNAYTAAMEELERCEGIRITSVEHEDCDCLMKPAPLRILPAEEPVRKTTRSLKSYTPAPKKSSVMAWVWAALLFASGVAVALLARAVAR